MYAINITSFLHSYRKAALAKYLNENMPMNQINFPEVAKNTGMLVEDIIPTLVLMGILSKKKGRPVREEKMREIVEEMKPKFEARKWISMEKLDFDVPPTKPKEAQKSVQVTPYPLRSRNKPVV